MKKSNCINPEASQENRIHKISGTAPTLGVSRTMNQIKILTDETIIGGEGITAKALTETRTDEAKKIRKKNMKEGKDYSPRRGKELKVRNDDNANTVTSAQGVEQLIMIQVKSATKEGFEIAKDGDSINFSMPNSKTRRGRVGVAQTLDTQVNQGVIQLNQSKESGGNQPYQQNRVYSIEGLIPNLDEDQRKNILISDSIRRLTEIECERLQGFPDNHTKFGNYDGEIKEVSRTQRYKLCGNAITKNMAQLIGIKIRLNAANHI